MKLRWATALVMGILTAVVLALLLPAVAASDAGKIVFIGALFVLFRSSLWMTGRLSGGREGRT
jgi:hypothetical protein